MPTPSTETLGTPDLLQLDAAAEAAQIADTLRDQVQRVLRRKGLVLGLSGGIDSSVTAALAVQAVGRARVLGLLMPDEESSDDSQTLGRLVADHLGIEALMEPIDAPLRAFDCYRRRDDAIRRVVPQFGAGWKSKLVLASAIDSKVPVSSILVQSPSGEQMTARLTAEAYTHIVAAANFKQRVRKTIEYYHADRLQYAVAGTPNRLEYDQGFFVKGGDGAADVKPIAHLYKTQVRQLARHLDIPDAIVRRPSTTDTFSLPQTQEEFYFSVPLHVFDLCLYGRNHDLPAERIAAASGLTAEEVRRVYAAIDGKRRATRYLQMPPLTVEAIDEIGRIAAGERADAATEP